MMSRPAHRLAGAVPGWNAWNNGRARCEAARLRNRRDAASSRGTADAWDPPIVAKRRERLRRSPGTPFSRVVPLSNEVDPALVPIDLLRADLYRMLDEMARARNARHAALVAEFERSWVIYKLITTSR